MGGNGGLPLLASVAIHLDINGSASVFLFLLFSGCGCAVV